jgi:hypothetical protein
VGFTADCTDIGLTAQQSMTSTLDRRSLLLSWVLECVYMPSLCSRFDFIATRPKTETSAWERLRT